MFQPQTPSRLHPYAHHPNQMMMSPGGTGYYGLQDFSMISQSLSETPKTAISESSLMSSMNQSMSPEALSPTTAKLLANMVSGMNSSTPPFNRNHGGTVTTPPANGHFQAHQQQVQQLPQQKSNQGQRARYKIEFPPGPMGLELEPVIKSTEREIGCRVKDFYFAVDHCGVTPEFLLARVKLGDMISSINGEDIKSWPFAAILDKLRSLKDQTRIISFRNISASCKSFPPFLLVI